MKNIGKIFLSLLCVLICCAVSSNIRIYAEAIQPYSMPETNGIIFGQYYRIRLQHTDYYLTLDSNEDKDGITCSLHTRTEGDAGQIFYIGGNNSTGTYYFKPLSSPSGRVLSLASSGTGENVKIVLRSQASSNLQRWNISTTTPGYQIRSYSNGKVMGAMSNNINAGTAITSRTYQTGKTDWRFEPAYSGSASYFVAANDLSSSGSKSVNNIVSDLSNCDYTTTRVDLPVTGHVRMATPGNRLTVIHGHGSAGMICLEQQDNTDKWLFSENPSSGNIALNFTMNRNSLVIFISCNSATASNNRKSMTVAAREQGAACAIGFNNSVAGGEKYVEKLIYQMNLYPSATLNDLILAVNTTYSTAEKSKASCPAVGVQLLGYPISANMR